MALYTVFNSSHPSEHTPGLSLREAADSLLSEDGHRWELRTGSSYRAGSPARPSVSLWRSQNSVNAYGGSGPLLLLAPYKSFRTRTEALTWVVQQDDWKGLEALSDEEYVSWMAEL